MNLYRKENWAHGEENGAEAGTHYLSSMEKLISFFVMETRSHCVVQVSLEFCRAQRSDCYGVVP